jgi:hypothetical protein
MLKMMAALSFRNSGTGISVLFPDYTATHQGQIACQSKARLFRCLLPFHFETPLGFTLKRSDGDTPPRAKALEPI